MRHLLAALDTEHHSGTHGTLVGPRPNTREATRKINQKQSDIPSRTRGTHGTPKIELALASRDLSNPIADLADAHDERVALCTGRGVIIGAEACKLVGPEVDGELARRLCWEPCE
jgi:hypothetical protein